MLDYPKPVKKEIFKKILEQMTNSIFKVNEKNGNFDIGCFCYIKNGNKTIPVVVINNYKIDIEFNNTINVSINKEIKQIELGITRYKNKDNNISIIELKKEKIKNINFIEIDDKLYEKESEMFYYKKPIYIIQYNNAHDISISFGKLNNIDNNKIIIFLI